MGGGLIGKMYFSTVSPRSFRHADLRESGGPIRAGECLQPRDERAVGSRSRGSPGVANREFVLGHESANVARVALEHETSPNNMRLAERRNQMILSRIDAARAVSAKAITG